MDIRRRERERKENWLVKAPMALKEKFDEIRRQRIIKGKDKEMVDYKRILTAISRDDITLKRLAEADFIDDKKAQTTFNIFTFMIFAFLVVLLLGGLIYAQGLIYNVFQDVGLHNEQNANSSGYVNLTLVNEQTFGQVNQSIQALRLVALMMILGEAVSIIVTNAMMKVNPIWFFAYILISLLAIIFSVPIANAYETLLSSNIYNGGLISFTTANWLILNLPILVMFISLAGGVLLFINIIRQPGETNLS